LNLLFRKNILIFIIYPVSDERKYNKSDFNRKGIVPLINEVPRHEIDESV